MFEQIMEKFSDSPSQQQVIRLLLERGFSVNDDGRVVSGGIEIPNTGIAREVGVDRRVVDATTDAILADDELRPIFQNISAIPSLMDLAPVLDLTVLTATSSPRSRRCRSSGGSNWRECRSGLRKNEADPPGHRTRDCIPGLNDEREDSTTGDMAPVGVSSTERCSCDDVDNKRHSHIHNGG